MRDNEFSQVVAAAQAGADWAWRCLYRELAPGILGYLRARRAADADDLTGEVLLQVVRDVGSFSGDRRAFRAWVFVIAHHRLLDDRRRRSRRPFEMPGDTAEEPAAGDVEAEALSALGTAWGRQVIDELSPDQRDVLLLRVMGELTVSEVAVAVGKRPGAVKALQRRGLRAIARKISEAGVPQ